MGNVWLLNTNYYVVFLNRLGLGHAVELAASLKNFPQLCMQADKKSAYYATFSAKSLKDALQYEFNNGKAILEQVKVYVNGIAFPFQ